MDKESLIKFSPWIVVALGFFMQYNFFVTPAQLEQKHRDILSEVAKSYATKSEFNITKDQLSSMNTKIDKIYDILVNKR